MQEVEQTLGVLLAGTSRSHHSPPKLLSLLKGPYRALQYPSIATKVEHMTRRVGKEERRVNELVN
jgi:hypothetical protein